MDGHGCTSRCIYDNNKDYKKYKCMSLLCKFFHDL